MTIDKKQVTADEIVANLKKYAKILHDDSKQDASIALLLRDENKFVASALLHSVSHDLMGILDGKSAEDVLFEDEEDESGPFAGSISVNIKSGEVRGIDDITDPELKEELADAIRKLADKLGGK